MAVPPLVRTVQWGVDRGIGAALAAPRLGIRLALRALDTGAALGDAARQAAASLRAVVGEDAAPGPFSDDDFASEWEAEAPAAAPSAAEPQRDAAPSSPPARPTPLSPPPPSSSAEATVTALRAGLDQPRAAAPSADSVLGQITERARVVEEGLDAAVSRLQEDADEAGVAQPPMIVADPVAPAGEVAEGARIDHADLPLADYDHLTLGSLRGRLRRLDPVDLGTLRDYERAHANRLPVVTMLENRLRKLAEEAPSEQL